MMLGLLHTAGEALAIDCDLPWVADLIEESAGADLVKDGSTGSSSIRIRIEAEHGPFDVRGWARLTRGAWQRDGRIVMEDACTTGFDMLVSCDEGLVRFTFRWRPNPRSRAAGLALRSRFHLLARAVLVQYPAMWWAGTRGRTPLHASAFSTGEITPLLAGPGGVGKSTLLFRELATGASAIGDNLCVADGATVWGLVEPLRIEGGAGRRMPHGRREAPFPRRVREQVPDRVVVVRRGLAERPVVRSCDPDAAARWLTAGTYMAGELRRYWSFAATLSLGTRAGPPHPTVDLTATTFAGRLPCIEVILGRVSGVTLSELLRSEEVGTWPRA
jgi:hypothetical protein